MVTELSEGALPPGLGIPPDKEPRTLDCYVDETELTLNGRRVLIYGIAISKAGSNAVPDMLRIRERYGLGPEIEVKWSLKHPDRDVKAAVKEDAISSLASNFWCLVNLTPGTDRDAAFTSVLDQIRRFALARGAGTVSIYYDEGAFRDRKRVEAVLDSWDTVRCTMFARVHSKYSIPIQYADLLAGTFRYMMEARFHGRTLTVSVKDQDGSVIEEMELDNLFYAMLRYSMWGEDPVIPRDGPIDLEMMTRDCFGTGVVANPGFTDAELEELRWLAKFYLGCMH
jgi:hypothetical protein